MTCTSNLPRPTAIPRAYSVVTFSVFDFLVPAFGSRWSRGTDNGKRSYGTSPRRQARGICWKLKTGSAHIRVDAGSEPGLRDDRHFHTKECKRRVYFATSWPASPHHTTHPRVVSSHLLERRKGGTGTRIFQPHLAKSSLARCKSSLALGGREPGKVVNAQHSNDLPQNRFPPAFFSDSFEQEFAASSSLPIQFFEDIHTFRNALKPSQTLREAWESDKPVRHIEKPEMMEHQRSIEEKLKLLRSIRDLEDKLAKAKQDLQASTQNYLKIESHFNSVPNKEQESQTIRLTKEDYINLVDLYYHSYNDRFSPEATDASPTPQFLNDYSFKLSEDFSAGKEPDVVNEDEDYKSPLAHTHRMLKDRQLKEIAVMQIFVDLLLDDASSNRALYDAYKSLPDPGVAFLPKGVIRLFLQRMSTPWTHSRKSMLRYTSLIDDMQRAKLPITVSEWSSAVYLAGRSFARVTESDVATSLKVWQTMEQEAGVESSHVTFNILFDIAVRAGKFALGQTILKEMHRRNLRLNRCGRVSLIYYHGLRRDGDGVRKAYRDFVEAGEIVDTLVLNCVIASLMNAGEPTAAEQVYSRMKSLQRHAQTDVSEEASDVLFTRYPPPSESTIDRELASNHIGRILDRAKHLHKVLPEKHQELQNSMPLRPDAVTFRIMLAHHATVTGDLNRVSVLLNEMTDLFDMPLRTITFQHLFKGFAIHGPLGGPDGAWSVKRLDLCWTACRDLIKASQQARKEGQKQFSETASSDSSLPSIKVVNAITSGSPLPVYKPLLKNPPHRRLSGWNDFVLDLAVFPKERLRRIERFHGQMFDQEDLAAKNVHPGTPRHPFHTFDNPFFQSTVYHAPEEGLDKEEGEYVLPGPTETAVPGGRSIYSNDDGDEANDRSKEMSAAIVHPDDESVHFVASNSVNARQKDLVESSGSTSTNNSPSAGHSVVVASRPLINWLIRAYARNTKSRAKVEEIYSSVRKLWRPKDDEERESVVRVLRRCLRDCDRDGCG